VLSRFRHRRLQALSLVALAALLTTSLCLGPLYQRAMEQALSGSVLAGATEPQKALRLTAEDRPPSELETEVPARLDPYLTAPIASQAVQVTVGPPPEGVPVATRLYAVDDACTRLRVVEGSCPAAAGEVMVSSEDVAVNGWTLGAEVSAVEQGTPIAGTGPPVPVVRIVGVYAPPDDETWLGMPITGRAGFEVQDVGVATDDWVTAAATMSLAKWGPVTSSVVRSLGVGVVDHDALLTIGPAVEGVRQDAQDNPSGVKVRVETDLPELADEVARGDAQGRTTVVVLVAQLLILIGVVLWMVLVAATDDRRSELALARLRGRGRRGAAAYLLAELTPLTLLGVAAGVIAAPFVMAVVAKAVFPVPVPLEFPGGYLLAALASAAAVALVVLSAAARAVREPVDSLLRAVPSRRGRAGAGVVEVVLIVFSLTAVVALVTGNLEGPLATLAPTLLAVAAGLLLARGLAPATLATSRWLLRRGRAVAATGIVNAVRRPAARRVLVMVVVATALLVFCVDALVTGQQIRQNAAEQQNGAPYSLDVDTSSLDAVVAALAEADPDHQHLTAVATTSLSGLGTGQGPTVAVDSAAFPKVAYFPLADPGRAPWSAISAPQVEPAALAGTTVEGTLDAADVLARGPGNKRLAEVAVKVQLRRADGGTQQVTLATLPATGNGTVPFSVAVPCEEPCVVTGLVVTTPPGLQLSGSVTPRDLKADGGPVDLGPTTAWRRATGTGGSLVPTTDAAGNLGATFDTSGSQPPVMFSAWVPEPVPALVTSAEEGQFTGPGLEGPVDMSVAGTLARVPGSPPSSRVVDLEGLLRRPEASVSNVRVEVWADGAAPLARAEEQLKARGVTVRDVTTVDDVRAELDASPAAWSLALSVLVGGAAILVAALVMLVATATTWRARATDLAALRMAGLPGRSLRRMELLGQLPVVVAGVVTGAACGVVAAVFALPGLRQFTDPPAVDTTDFSTPWPAVGAAAVVALLVMTLLAVATSRWTASRAPLNRIREVV
jgi:putative ABC transport system permease protein